MSSTMEHKGYIGSVELSEVEGIFYGKVLGIRSLISYEGTNAPELIGDFHGAIDDYLTACEEEGIKPEIPYKGSFNVRIGSELHRSAAVYAYNHDISLNSFIEDAVRNRLEMLSAGR